MGTKEPTSSTKKTESFSFFGSTAKKAPVAPTPTPSTKEPAVPTKKSESFSFFGSTAKKSAVPSKPEPVPAPAPTPKKAQPFSFLGTPAKKPEPVTKEPAPSPSPKKAEPFSFFGQKTPVKRGSGTISIKPSKATVKRGTVKSSIQQPKTKVKRKSGTFSIKLPKPDQPAKKTVAPKDNIPIIRGFKQNPDGSLTGRVFNSDSFRAGTRITTSAVKQGAKSGQVVTTSSGSKYRLE